MNTLLTPKQLAVRDMRAAGLDTSVLRFHRTVIVTEIEEFVYYNGYILNSSKRIKRTITTETILK